MFKIEIKGFDQIQRRLERMARDVQSTTDRLNRTVVETPLSPDERGFVDRSCPNCAFFFKIANDNPSGKVTTCPSCGYGDPDARWETASQREHAVANAREHVGAAVKRAFSGSSLPMARGRLIDGGINVMRGDRWVVVGLPAQASEALRLERNCQACGCRFAFIGSAFFCPSCGLSSAEETFKQSIEQIHSAARVCRQLAITLPPDDAANFQRAILEKGMADLVTSFQFVAEKLYQRKTGSPAPLNAFQRLDGGSDGDTLWKAATGKSYVDYLGSADYARLRMYFQRRHLLAHANGFVDQRYVDRSGDTTYAVGQRLVVRADELEEFARVVETIVVGMQSDVP